VSEEPDVIVGLGKWESAPRQDTYGAHGVPAIECVRGYARIVRLAVYSPNADKFDVNVERERFFEPGALVPAFLIFTRIHLIGEWDLLVVARWKKSNLRAG